MSRTDNALNGRALALARVSEKAEILRRHYQETRNSLFAWEVIRLFTRLPGPPVPLPPWVSEHLRDVSSALIDLAEGIDRTQAPPIPPVGATDKQIAEFITKYRAFEERPTLDPKQAHARALRALGFLSVQGKNVFADYWRNLRAQNDAEQALFLQAQHNPKGARSHPRPGRCRCGADQNSDEEEPGARATGAGEPLRSRAFTSLEETFWQKVGPIFCLD